MRQSPLILSSRMDSNQLSYVALEIILGQREHWFIILNKISLLRWDLRVFLSPVCRVL